MAFKHTMYTTQQREFFDANTLVAIGEDPFNLRLQSGDSYEYRVLPAFRARVSLRLTVIMVSINRRSVTGNQTAWRSCEEVGSQRPDKNLRFA